MSSLRRTTSPTHRRDSSEAGKWRIAPLHDPSLPNLSIAAISGEGIWDLVTVETAQHLRGKPTYIFFFSPLVESIHHCGRWRKGPSHPEFTTALDTSRGVVRHRRPRPGDGAPASSTDSALGKYYIRIQSFNQSCIQKVKKKFANHLKSKPVLILYFQSLLFIPKQTLLKTCKIWGKIDHDHQ